MAEVARGEKKGRAEGHTREKQKKGNQIHSVVSQLPSPPGAVSRGSKNELEKARETGTDTTENEHTAHLASAPHVSEAQSLKVPLLDDVLPASPPSSALLPL